MPVFNSAGAVRASSTELCTIEMLDLGQLSLCAGAELNHCFCSQVSDPDPYYSSVFEAVKSQRFLTSESGSV